VTRRFTTPATNFAQQARPKPRAFARCEVRPAVCISASTAEGWPAARCCSRATGFRRRGAIDTTPLRLIALESRSQGQAAAIPSPRAARGPAESLQPAVWQQGCSDQPGFQALPLETAAPIPRMTHDAPRQGNFNLNTRFSGAGRPAGHAATPPSPPCSNRPGPWWPRCPLVLVVAAAIPSAPGADAANVGGQDN